VTPNSGPLAKALATVRLDSIKNRILALAVVATLAPALGTAVLSYRQNRQALAENLNGELRSRGSQGAREVDLWVKERFYDVRVFTGSFEVSENLERIRRGGADALVGRDRLRDYLVGVKGRFSDYEELLVTDTAGRPVASSREPLGEVQLPDAWLIRLSRGETVLAEPGFDERRSRMTATLATPVMTGDARFLGVLTATLTFEAVGPLLESVAPGEGGRVDAPDQDAVARPGALGHAHVDVTGRGGRHGVDPPHLEASGHLGTPPGSHHRELPRWVLPGLAGGHPAVGRQDHADPRRDQQDCASHPVSSRRPKSGTDTLIQGVTV